MFEKKSGKKVKKTGTFDNEETRFYINKPFKINSYLRRDRIMDWRVIIVVAPIAIAASWAIFNIGSAALAQAQKYFNKQS